MTTKLELERILGRRPGGQLGMVVIDHPDRFDPELLQPWSRSHRDGSIVHQSTLQVLNPRGRELLAEVADATAWTRTWGARLVRQWVARWHERAAFIAYCGEFPAATPGAFSGGAGWPWPRHATPPVNDGHDLAASLLCKHKHNHGDAQLEVEQLALTERVHWQVSTNLRLAPLKVSEALAAWPR